MPADGRSAYAIALDALRQVIASRASLYRHLVITVACAGVSIVVAATALQSPLPLAALLALPAIVSAYHAADFARVHSWRNSIVSAWAEGRLDIGLFASTARVVPGLPEGTVAGMLACLPGWAGSVPHPAARNALLVAQDRLGRLAVADLRLRGAFWASLPVGLGVSIVCSGQAAMSIVGALLASFAVVATSTLLMRHALHQIRAALAASLAPFRQDPADAMAALDGLNLEGLSRRLRKAWLRAGASHSS